MSMKDVVVPAKIVKNLKDCKEKCRYKCNVKINDEGIVYL